MFPIPYLVDDLFDQPKTMAVAETLPFDSDLRDDIFAPSTTTVAERRSKFQPKTRFNNRNLPNPSNSSTSKGSSSTSNFHDAADIMISGHVENFQSKVEAITKSGGVIYETLYSDSDLRDDKFAPTTTVERSKIHTKPFINNLNIHFPSKSIASEGPSSTSDFHDVVDGEHVENFQSEVKTITKSARANYGERVENFQSEIEAIAKSARANYGENVESFQSEVEAIAKIERANSERSKLHPKSCFNDNNLPDSLKSSASKGPSSTSNFHDAAVDGKDAENFQSEVEAIAKSARDNYETLYSNSDLLDGNFAPTTTIERRSKFHPKPRINNKNLPNPPKSNAAEGPSFTSNFHDAAIDGEHVENFQPEVEAITKSARPNYDYSQLDSLPIHNESLDANGSRFSADELVDSLEIKTCICSPAYSSEDRAYCGKINDSEAQTLTAIEYLHHMEGRHPIDHTEEPNFEECAPSSVQNDEAGEASLKGREGNKKLKLNVNTMSGTYQKTKKNISNMDVDYGDDGYKNDDIPKQSKKKLRRKSSSKCSEHENLIKSSKTSSEDPRSAVIKNPTKKRLVHGSRRCKSANRQVNKALLDIPDDELDRKQLVIKDLIQLFGFKERLSNKVATVLKKSFAKKSVQDEQVFNGDDTSGNIQQEGPRLNYHSYMRRPLQSRWSKTDTEFFYQAIRQFGTDFAMIQVLFPNRSRQQVKAKFKNEQRKHPLQIADALVYRSKDHSHFEKVIQHLQTVAEQNSQNAASDSTTQLEDEADQKKEEKMEANSKEEQDESEGGVACSLKSNDGD